jgi:hypothetical protein
MFLLHLPRDNFTCPLFSVGDTDESVCDVSRYSASVIKSLVAEYSKPSYRHTLGMMYRVRGLIRPFRVRFSMFLDIYR